MASSTPLVISTVLAQGNFSTTMSRPGLSLITASPMSGWWSSTTRPISPILTSLPVPSTCSGTFARSSGVMIGSTLRTLMR
jgi:hypothetical protein